MEAQATNASNLTISNKKDAKTSFDGFLNRNRGDFNLAPWIRYEYGFSHDGFTFHSNSSNSFGCDEIMLIAEFCKTNNYSFGFIGRKTENVSMYGSVECEINIAK